MCQKISNNNVTMQAKQNGTTKYCSGCSVTAMADKTVIKQIQRARCYNVIVVFFQTNYKGYMHLEQCMKFIRLQNTGCIVHVDTSIN